MNTTKRDIYTQFSINLAYQSFEDRLKEEYMDIESTCTKMKMFIETLTEEILKVALRETEFDSQDQSDENYFCG